MAHYDCDNCGERMGIGFGSCRACTPERYRTLSTEISQLHARAEHAWKVHVKAEMEELASRQSAFIAAFEEEPMKLLNAEMHELRMKHDHGYKWSYEDAQKKRMIHGPTGEEIFVAPGAQIPLFPDL